MSDEKFFMQCSNCFFWKKSYLKTHQHETDGDRTGYCFRYPPVADVIAARADALENQEDTGSFCETYTWVRPAVYSIDFCGEFRHKKLTVNEDLASEASN